MTLFIQTVATGAGTGDVDAARGQVDLVTIANLDDQVGFTEIDATLQQVTYARTATGPPPERLDLLVNTDFGVNPEGRDILVIPVLGNFVFADGFMITAVAGRALPPAGSGQPGDDLNSTTSCIAVYDTSDANGLGWCVARDGTGDIDLGFPASAILYHELSHCLRIVQDQLLDLGGGCDPSSPEENAAIVDENDMRTQLATLAGEPAALRDPGIHCGGNGPCGDDCCIVATVVSGSHVSDEVGALRALRDRYLRRHEAGFAFFASLHFAYYGFSPEVVRLLARRPQLKQRVLDGYVRPLVAALRTVTAYTLDGLRGAALGRWFRGQPQAGPEGRDAASALALLAGEGAALAALPPADRELAELLVARALPSDHVRWALIEPVRLHDGARALALAGASDAELGGTLAGAIDAWAGELPLEPFWQSLTTDEARAELDFLERCLLAGEGPRRRFRERLAAAYPDAPALARASTGASREAERR